MPSPVAFVAWVGLTLGALGCSSISTVRVQSDNVYVGPNLRPVAVVHAQATSAYILFLAVPGGVDLDRVVNRMLIIAAKTMGADKVANLQVDITPDSGVWTLRKLLGWRTAEASGIAVIVDDPADPDPGAGPEPTAPGAPSAPAAAPGATAPTAGRASR